MKIQVNSDKSVNVDQGLTQAVETAVRRNLDRFSERLTRVEVHLSDVDGNRGGIQDKRCVLEARPAGLDPVAVTHQAATIDEAATGAALKMLRMLDSLLGKLAEKR